MPKKKIEAIVEDVREEANETAGVIEVKRWQVAAFAAALAIFVLVVIL